MSPVQPAAKPVNPVSGVAGSGIIPPEDDPGLNESIPSSDTGLSGPVFSPPNGGPFETIDADTTAALPFNPEPTNPNLSGAGRPVFEPTIQKPSLGLVPPQVGPEDVNQVCSALSSQIVMKNPTIFNLIHIPGWF